MKSLNFSIEGPCDCTIHWGDGNSSHYETEFTETISVFYQYTGTQSSYTVSITGTVYAVYFPEQTDTVDAFSPSCDHYFMSENVRRLPEILLTNITDLNSMFANTRRIDECPNLPNWNTSHVTIMERAFSGTDLTSDINLSNWDTSNVTNMSFMFQNSTTIDPGISSWDTSAVVSFEWMFQNAENFNGNISSWDTSSATTMVGMFSSASAFNVDIGAWSVSNVLTFQAMFANASSFNQDLTCWHVQHIPAPQFNFSGGADSWQSEYRPRWGQSNSDVNGRTGLSCQMSAT